MTEPNDVWDAGQYLKFSLERSRPFADLLAQVRSDDPRSILDLGCGTGSLTRILADRWPRAHVVGVDLSPEMLQQARPLAIPGKLEFCEGDLATYSPRQPIDLLVSNAALQWVADHPRLLKRLSDMLAPQGTLAVQMPNRFQTPSQTAIEETTADPRWKSALEGVGLDRESVMPILWYAEYLHGLGFAVNAWEATYVHVLSGSSSCGASPVLEWLKGTALRPLLARLNAQDAEEFLRQLDDRLRRAYPPSGDVTFFPMPRLFFVARRTT